MAPDRFELPAGGLPAAQLCLAQRVPVDDAVRVRAAARRSGAFAAELRHTTGVLLSGVESALWRGPAHQTLVCQLRSHAPQLSATADRYDGYALALNSYAVVLDDTADELRVLRRQLQERSAELASRCGDAAHPDAGVELAPLARAFKAGYDRWADGLDRCVRALHWVDEHDPTRDLHGLRAFTHQLGGVATTAVRPFEQAMRHPSLHAVSACLGELNTGLSVLGLGLLFICPPAGAACLAAATVLAVAQFAVDSIRREHGENVSTASLGLELAAAIPFGGNAVRGVRAADNVVHLVPGGGLMAHEGVDGAHTLAKHVGKSEAYLRNRLATEQNIKGASTFYDRQTAEIAIHDLLKANRAKINRWLRGDQRQLRVNGSSGQPLGWLVLPGSSVMSEECGIRVILSKSTYLGVGYHIHTAMVTK